MAVNESLDRAFIELSIKYHWGTEEVKDVQALISQELKVQREAIRERMPDKLPTESEFHTADMRYVSSTQVELFRNEGFNQAIQDITKILDGEQL